MFVQNANFKTKKPLFWENSEEKLKRWAPIIPSAENLQLFVKILLKICSVCRKIATSGLAIFWLLYDAAVHWKSSPSWILSSQFQPVLLHYRILYYRIRRYTSTQTPNWKS